MAAPTTTRRPPKLLRTVWYGGGRHLWTSTLSTQHDLHAYVNIYTLLVLVAHARYNKTSMHLSLFEPLGLGGHLSSCLRKDKVASGSSMK
eukprot:1152411-Amphidinium_carterae.1